MRMDRYAGLLASGKLAITYTGAFTDELVNMDGSPFRLLTLITSGTLRASAAVTGDIWVCGGGGAGGRVTHAYNGGGGGYTAESDNVSFRNLTVVIGAGGSSPNVPAPVQAGTTSISGDVNLSAEGGYSGGQTSTYANAASGGTGGGGGGPASSSFGAGTGDGTAKKPFESSYFVYPFCDGGGGGGGYAVNTSARRKGGAGGTNGGNGVAATATSNTMPGGAGGGHYGGAGGAAYQYSSDNGSAATGYGSGSGACGGGGGTKPTPPNGYQGVCFIRIPV